MIITKRLDNPELIEEACSLLYREYIENGSWVFSSENPSELKVVTKNNRKFLIDRITQHAIWFGAFNNNIMVGCIRLFRATKDIPFEIETYPAAKKIVAQYIEVNKPNVYEASRACVDSAYKGENILTILYLAILEYCQEERSSIFGSTSKGYLKSVLRQIEWPCKKEEAFKFEETDYAPVNFYFASYKDAEVSHMIQKIKSFENKKSINIFDALNVVAPIFPAAMYWHDTKGVVLGINAQCLRVMDKSRDEVLGKTPYDFYAKEIADHIWQHSKKVIESGETLSQEEYIYDALGECIGVYLAIKAPLYDEHGYVIGIVGTSIDLTAEKEAERLKIEKGKQTTLLEEKEKFTKIANQVAHDIRSPLASLLMIVKSCTQIPEEDRISLREAAVGIGDIANHLLSHYQKKESDQAIKSEERQPMLVSAMLLQILAEKKYQYQKSLVKFDSHFSAEAHFVFIKVGASSFKRMISNLINNAVDAFDDNNPGRVDLNLEVDGEWVKIFVKDNGKGMPQHIVDKVINKIAVTAGKESGHGIGLTQVWETLEKNHADLFISSQLGKGTTITVQFPRINSPSWIADEIVLGNNDIVLILDDDTSIHGAWRARFEPILLQAPAVQLKHFQVGREALEFMNNLSVDEKKKILLLTDYELLKQELNGLHVVAQSRVERSVLVTSHYANPLIQEQAAKTGTKILPKQLASEIPIVISADIMSEMNQINVVIVDDDKSFVKSLMMFVFDPETTDPYYNPEHFLASAHKYDKNTKIFLDNNYDTSDLKGLAIAKELHDLGFTRLYLLSGDAFQDGSIPDYVTLVRKSDIDNIKKL